jgi:hypothetical protein
LRQQLLWQAELRWLKTEKQGEQGNFAKKMWVFFPKGPKIWGLSGPKKINFFKEVSEEKW